MAHNNKEETPIKTPLDCISELCDHLLGKDYFIPDPVSPEQAAEIITQDIINAYPKRNESPEDAVRRKLKQCQFCTHCESMPPIFGNTYSETAGYCKVRKKCVKYRHKARFCKAFKLLPYTPIDLTKAPKAK